MALGAASVARSSGKQIFITGRNGDTAALEAIAAGRLGGTYAYDGEEMGRQAIWGAYDAQTSQGMRTVCW